MTPEQNENLVNTLTDILRANEPLTGDSLTHSIRHAQWMTDVAAVGEALVRTSVLPTAYDRLRFLMNCNAAANKTPPTKPENTKE